MMEQFVQCVVVGVLVCLTFSATAAHAQPQGSGQGSGSEISITFQPISTATQSLIVLPSLTAPLPAASDEPHPPPSITDNVAPFSIVPLLPSSLTPSLATPPTPTPLPSSPLSLQSSKSEPFPTMLPVDANTTDLQNTASFDENDIFPSSTLQPRQFLPLTSAVVLTSSQIDLLLPQLTPTPTRQVLTTEALMEFPDPTSTTPTQQLASTIIAPIVMSNGDVMVTSPELTSSRFGEIGTSLPLRLSRVTLTPAPPSSAVLVNTQTIPGFSELFLSLSRRPFATETPLGLSPTPSLVSSDVISAITAVQNDTAATSQPVTLLPLQSTPQDTPSIKISPTPVINISTSSIDISTTEAVMIFPEVTTSATQSQTTQFVLLMPESTPSPSHVISSSEAVVLLPESSSPLSSEVVTSEGIFRSTSDGITSSFDTLLPTTFISSGGAVVSTPVMEGEIPVSSSIIDFFFPPQSTTQDLSLLFTSSLPQATPTPTPQVRPTSSGDMLLVPMATSELVTLPISTLFISPSPAITPPSSTQDSTDFTETSEIFVFETTELITSPPSISSPFFPTPSPSTPSLAVPTQAPISTEIRSTVDQLTLASSSVPLFLLPVSSSSSVPDKLTATPISSSRPITILDSVIPTPLPSVLQSTTAPTPLPSATPTSPSPPPTSSESDVSLIQTSSLSVTSSIVTIATSAIDDLSTSVNLLIPFPTTIISTFVPTPSSSSSELTFAPTPLFTSFSDPLTFSPSTTLKQLSTTQLAITSSIVSGSDSTDSTSILLPFSPSAAVESSPASSSSTPSVELLFPTPSPLLPLEPSPTPLLSPSSATVASDDVIITSSGDVIVSSLTTQADLPLFTSSAVLLLEPSSVLSLSPESTASVESDIFEVQETTPIIEITTTPFLTTVAMVTSTATESQVAIQPSPSITLLSPSTSVPVSLEPSPSSSSPAAIIPSESTVSSPPTQISSEIISTETFRSSLAPPVPSSATPSPSLSSPSPPSIQQSTSIIETVLSSAAQSSLVQVPSLTATLQPLSTDLLVSPSPLQTTSQLQTSSLTTLQPSSTTDLLVSPSPLQTTIPSQPLQSSAIESSPLVSTRLRPSSQLQPSLTSSQLASTAPASTSTTLLSLLESPTSPTPSPTPCPSLLAEGDNIPQSSLVPLRLGLTTSKHALIAMVTSPERCELERALADAIFGNTDSSSAGRVARRQASGTTFDADITDVGPLLSGTSVITFYILNGTDPEALPTFVPAAAVITAIQNRNLTQILTYPIIGIDEAPPTGSSSSLVVPLAAGLGVALFLLVVVAVAMVLCVTVLYYNAHKTIKVEDNVSLFSSLFPHLPLPRLLTLRGAEAAETFARTNDFGQFSDEPSTSSGGAATVARETVAKKPPVSISQLANGWVEGEEATPTLARETPPSRQEHIPAGLFERVAHYESATPPQPSPSTRALKMKFHNTVAPSPSTSHKSHSSVEGGEPVRATPTALRPQCRSGGGGVARETVQSKEDDLRMQEQREEEELKKRRKATLERLMLQSRQRDTEIRSRIGSRRRKRHGSVAVETRVRPSTYGGVMPPTRWEPELDAAMGDVDSSSPFATPHPAEAMATTPRPTTRPSTKRRMARRKGNKIAPGATTDDYDSTDHAPHPYHMMMDIRGGGSVERKVVGSRGGSRMKHGRSHRGRPFSRDHGWQSTLGVSGRRSRGVAADVQRELAWMDTPGGVQLMRIQPILPAAAVAAPTFALPPHPSTGGQLISVQPRPHPKALTTPPHPRHSTLENLPTLAPPQPPSQNFTHKQLETLWREIEKFQLDQTMRRDSTATRQAPPTKATPTEQPKTKEKAKSTDVPQQTTASDAGEAGGAGEGGEAVKSEDMKPKDKDKKVDATQQQQATDEPSAQASSSRTPEEQHPVATLAPPTQQPPPPPLPDIDSSYSSAAAIQELLHQAFSASQSQGGGGGAAGAGQPWAASSTYQDSMDSGSHMLRLSGGTTYQPPSTAWHSVVSSQPLQPLAPPTHYSGLPGQLVWAPPDPHSFTPLHTQVISPAQLSQLRQQSSSQPAAATSSYDYDVSYTNDPYHTPPSAAPPPRLPTQQFFSPYSRYRRHDPFS